MRKEIVYILKRVIVGVLIAVILFGIKSCQVKAAELPTSYNRSLLNGLTFPPYNKFRYVGITDNGMTERTVADWLSSDLTTRYYYISGLYNDANGFAFSFLNDTVFVVGHNYNVALVYCTTTGVINGWRQFSVGTGTSYTGATQNASDNINNQKDYANLGAFYTDGEDFSTCFLAQVNFTANVGGNALAFKFWNSAGSINMGTLAFMGYYFDDLGQDFTSFKNQIISNITSSQTNIINNNNQNTQRIISEQQNTTEAIEDLNDSITSEAPPNLSSLNNSAGWLPAGPVDSILNLPLALLNNINTNLSKTCQPVILHIPLVDRDLPIPCIVTLYEQMGIMTWVNTIGAIASAFILFSYFVKLYKWVDDTLTFRENNYMDNWGGV